MSSATLQGKEAQATKIDPGSIMQVGMGFWASKVLLTAVKLKLFTRLAENPQSGEMIKKSLGLQTNLRHVYDLLDALVSLGFLEREGLLHDAVYSNSPSADVFLDSNKPSYIGGILEMANNRLYNFWGSLEDALITGKPQNESKLSGNMDFFTDLYKDPQKLQEFMDAMSGIQKGNFMTLVQKFDFRKYHTIADLGGADAALSIEICKSAPGVQCINFDLPPVGPLANKKIAQANLKDRIKFMGGDFMTDPLPGADVICMGNILHGLDEENKMLLINKVYHSIPKGGAIMVIENIIDNERRKNTFGLLMSLNMLIENGDAFDCSFDDFRKWTTAAGFISHELIPLTGPTSAAIAYK
jgi:hypothetical protein